MNWLLRIIARKVARPVERWWRKREDAWVDGALPVTLRISDLNRGLVPLACLVVATGISGVFAAGMILVDTPEANYEHWTEAWPFACFVVIIIGLAIWTFRQPLWVDIAADTVLVHRLASERQYAPADLRSLAFELAPELWGPLPPQHAGETRCKLRFSGGFQFDAALGNRKARLLYEAFDRLTRGANRWIAQDSQAAAYAQNPIRLSGRAAEALRQTARKAGLAGTAVVMASAQPAPHDPDRFTYQLDLIDGVPAGAILTESLGQLIAVERDGAAMLAGVTIGFNHGAGGTGYLFNRGVASATAVTEA